LGETKLENKHLVQVFPSATVQKDKWQMAKFKKSFGSTGNLK